MGKKILVITNENRNPNLEFSERVKKALTECKADFVFDSEAGIDYSEITEAIVLGGDGTLIRAADSLKDYGIPILGINTGTVGYLTGAENKDMEAAVQKLVSGQYRVEKRMMLDVSVNGGETETILNDCVLSRSGYSRLVNFDLYVNKKMIDRVSGDGVIVATPTGSTGYNLSAGGSVCVPDAEVILLTPVCAHSIGSRPVVAGTSDEIMIKVAPSVNPQINEVGLTLDGRSFLPLKEGDSVVVKRSKSYTRLITIDERNFFEILKNKLR